MPDDFYREWEGMKRVIEAAGEMGIKFTPQEKFINPSLCRPDCDSCLFGCRLGAKWTSRSYLNEAVELGASLITGAHVKRVLVENGRAVGVLARRDSEEISVYGDRIILSAGGVGTPWILQASGIEKAGDGFFTDPMSLVLGVSHGPGTFHEMTYSYASSDFLGEFIIGTTSATNNLMAQMARLNLLSILRVPYIRHIVGMFVKLCDSPVGRVEPGGKISKPLTGEDHERMERGIKLTREIMIKSGVKPKTIQVARYIGGHPGGTAGIGRVVDTGLETEIKNLYVCDASVLPRSAGIPLVLTLVALAKKFSRKF